MSKEELAVLEDFNAVEVFVAGGTDKLLQAIRDEVINDVPDLTTAKGRKEIASRAAWVGKSKVFIIKKADVLKAELKARLKPITLETTKVTDTLDKLRKEVRRPLTNWEDTETARVEGLKRRLSMNFDYSFEALQYTGISLVKEALENAKNTEIDDSWQEFEEQAAEAKPIFIEKLTEHLEKMVKKEEEAAELERLQKAERRRKREEREAQIAKDAAADAEAKAKAAIAREEAAKKKAKQDAKEAKEKAEEDKKAAVKAEQKRIADLTAEREAEELSREQDKAHILTIKKAIVRSLKVAGLSQADAIATMKFLVKGEIAHTKVKY